MISRLFKTSLLALMVIGLPGAARPENVALAQALGLPELFQILQDEGQAYGARLEDELFPGRGGADWDRAVADIYAPQALYAPFVARLEQELAENGADTEAILAYMQTPLAVRVVALELAARRAFLDEGLREAAERRAEGMAAGGDPRMAMLDGFATQTDMLEANVANALNASLAFYKGMADGGALPAGMSEGEMLSQVWAQEADIRAETEAWVMAYLATSYAPLSDAELADYTGFYATEPGRDLNRALFSAFDTVFAQVSRALGHAAAMQLVAQDL